jgi:hypothetical protein
MRVAKEAGGWLAGIEELDEFNDTLRIVGK